jgi:hypothetical protein
MTWWTFASHSRGRSGRKALGKGGKHDNRLAYAWLITALAFGVPAEAHDATVYTLEMTAARLGPKEQAGAEDLARKISVTIANRQTRTPDRKANQLLQTG